MDWKLEVVAISVSDVGRAKMFYADKLGFNIDVDSKAGEGPAQPDLRRFGRPDPCAPPSLDSRMAS